MTETPIQTSQAEPSYETPIPTQPATEVSEEYRLHRRMDRMARLVGDSAMEKLQKAHVMVIGLGGVGSWAAESLARAGVGRLSLVDFDQICITNTNRQLHALGGMVGKFKAEALAERFQKINPSSTFTPLVKFYNAKTENELLGETPEQHPDFVIDAIDNVTAKCHLLASCVRRGIPVISCTGSGGRIDPLAIRMADLSETEMDPLARSVRKILRDQYSFPREGKGKFKIPTVYSIESPRDPMELKYDNGKGFKCVCPQGQNGLNDCDMKNLIMGNAGFLTGTFGNVAASHVVRQIIGN